MYDQFYSLSAEPFRMSPDHRFCYKHTQYAKAMAYMAYAFMRGEGFVLITGNPGTGKTTLVGNLLESLADENVTVGNLVSTQLAADDLLRMVAFSFGVEVEGAEKSLVLQRLTNKLVNLFVDGGRALLIVDEAQDLTAAALEELRLLTNLQRDGKPLLQIFLLGQSELRDLVHSAGLEQVHQRIVAASHLQALKEAETRAYVEHRLLAVGWLNDPEISTAVYPVIFKFSEGVPRRINLFCSRLFLHACVERRHRICLEDARAVVIELQEEQLSTRNLLNDDMFFALDSFDGPLGHEDEIGNNGSEPATENYDGDSADVDPESGGVESLSEVKLETETEVDVAVAESTKGKARSKKSDTKSKVKSGPKVAELKSETKSRKRKDVESSSQLDSGAHAESGIKAECENSIAEQENRLESQPESQVADSDLSVSSHVNTQNRAVVNSAPRPDRLDGAFQDFIPEICAPELDDTGIDSHSMSQSNSASAIPSWRINLDAAVAWFAFLSAVILVVYLME